MNFEVTTIDAKLEQIVTAIHTTPYQLVYEFAGAGAQALAWLHGVAGSSRTILEATDRYAPTALGSSLGFVPEKFASLGVARALAVTAYQRAQQLTTAQVPVLGLGCTAAIATDRTRQGTHRCFVACYDGEKFTTYQLTLSKGSRDRQAEEHLVSLLLLQAIAEACDVTQQVDLGLLPTDRLEKQVEDIALLSQLLAEKVDWLIVPPKGHLQVGRDGSGLAILSGSFNPLHKGHRQMAEVTSRWLGREVSFELPLVNADKAPIKPEEALRRAAQFSEFASLFFTRAPLFSMKAELFSDTVFVLGVDTATRLVQTRFYNDDVSEMLASFDRLRQAGCRFLVAGRLDATSGRFMTMADVAVPPACQDLFEQIPEAEFRQDVSSTELRDALVTD